MLNEKRETFSKLFFFLSSTANWKEEINQHISNVSLHAINCPYDDFQKLSRPVNVFVSSDLQCGGEKRKVAREIFLEFLRRAAEISNLNLILNTNYLLTIMDVEPNVA